MKKQLAVLEKEIQIFKSDKNVEAVLIAGSVAYGSANNDSDLDLIVICNENKFVSEYIDDVLVEIHYHTYDSLLESLNASTIDIYKYLFSKIAFDNGKLNSLIVKAKEIYNDYSTPLKEKENICYWLSSTKIKLTSAINCNDEMKISYLISTNTWKLLEGVWAKNNKPMPPSSLAFAKHNELSQLPFDSWFEKLMLGDVLSKAYTMIRIIDWICE